MKQYKPIKCYCGSLASLRSNALLYNGLEYGNGKSYICNRFPSCRGSVGTHPDGSPLGIIADDDTKMWRIKVHAIIDPLWKNRKNGRSNKRNRGSVYGWLKRISGKEFHTAESTKEDCKNILKLINENPYRTV